MQFAAAGKAEDGDGDLVDDVAERGAAPIAREFNLAEFLSLASRVVDEGDLDSWAALNDLKRRWVEKFGDGAFTSPVGGGVLKPVATRPLRPFRRTLASPPRALRNVTLAPPSRFLNGWGRL
ncbi:UNVERIFIED_CONTAM: hypothetical protein Sradi_1890700 [Sesamum radiatum]|uniref:Uncharacterized protein n=1 Tax=Sesamum radiatum TaxID=300843 RepID=A0AAW2TZ81_SESRA